jgi:hypothetical protein
MRSIMIMRLAAWDRDPSLPICYAIPNGMLRDPCQDVARSQSSGRSANAWRRRIIRKGTPTLKLAIFLYLFESRS